MTRTTEIIHNAAEQFGDVTRSFFPWWSSISGIRGLWSGQRLGLSFWPKPHPATEGSEVNYDALRSIYRNDGEMALGTGFAKPIVDLQTAFMGLPTASTGSERTDEFLNASITEFWADEIQQMIRDTIRDSKTIVRMHKPDVLDPLMTLEEAEQCSLEIIVPERVDIERNARNKRIIERAVVRHKMVFVIEEGSITDKRDPRIEEHEVLEYITREKFAFFDQTDNVWLDSLGASNRWGFVPLLEVFNEWDSAMQGGQSDLETVIPFMRAFHDVVTQGLQAHGYHSTPKIVMNLADIMPFIKNNFPELIDETTGEVKQHAEMTWRGREIIFLQTDDEVSFLEAESILGDTKLLLEFLIDCICIASQTPEWAFMRVDSGSANSDRNAQTVPFIKKVERKRINFTKPIQDLCKMAMVIQDVIPVRPKLTWDVVRPDDQIVLMQAFQQLVMGLEVAASRGEISDETYRKAIREFLPMMKAAGIEAADAKRNVVPQLPPAPQDQPTPVVGAGQQ
jgi:hypothetical protein